MIVFVHTKFGLVRIQGSGVKRGAESAPRSERVFQIPVQIGLRIHFLVTSKCFARFSANFVSKTSSLHFELLSWQQNYERYLTEV